MRGSAFRRNAEPCTGRAIPLDIFFARINRRKPSLTVRRIPSSIRRVTVALLRPVMAQYSATENVTGDKGSLWSRGRRGFGDI
jgi:hypothetical protein